MNNTIPNDTKSCLIFIEINLSNNNVHYVHYTIINSSIN